MDNERRALLGLRYGPKDIVDYHKVMELVKENGLSKSEAGKRLIRRGLTHMDNPEPLVKEKIVEVPVEKAVLRDRYPYCKDCRGQPEPKHLGESVEEHITNEPIQEHIQGDPLKSGQHPSADKLMPQDKAGPPVTALGKKKSANWVGSTLIGGGLIAILVYLFSR